MSQATLFIPDISGFTKFVKSTEINHSKHIIEELIKIILHEGKEVFEVAEIEGDAVFFFKESELSPEQVINRAKQIFIQFHKHLLDYEHNRICECGACTSAVELKLKFITHLGSISMADYGTGSVKPYGDSVIAVHRLLKNNIPSDQYLLFTNEFLKDSGLELDGSGCVLDEALGEIDYKYIDIAHWRSEVVISRKELIRENVDFEVSYAQEIPMAAVTLHKFISEFRFRHLWNEGADEIIYDKEVINQTGEQHFCVVNGKDLVFDTIKPVYNDGLSYGEILKNPAPLKYMELNFFMHEVSPNISMLRIVIRASLKWQLHRLGLPLIRKKMKQQATHTWNAIDKAITSISQEELAA